MKLIKSNNEYKIILLGVIIGLAVFIWLLISTDAFAEDICFAPDVASKLVVEIEQCRNTTEQNTLLEQALDKCNKQIEICKEQKEQDNKACDEMIKAVKPSFFSRAKDMLTGAGIAGIVIVIGVLAL